MPKMRTHNATAKRFNIEGTGKLLRPKQRSTHLRRKTSKRVRRAFDKDHPVSKADEKRIRRLLALRTRK